MTTAVHPAWLLDQARLLLDEPSLLTRGRWARATALLLRQALESAAGTICSAWAPGLSSTPMRTQLLCLPAALGDDSLAGDVAGAWTSLSLACHYHPYDLPPTFGELRGWADVVAALVARLPTDDVVRPAE